MAGRSKTGPKAGSGLENGTWTPEFPGQRPPFDQGNQLATKAGDRALLKLRPRAAELAEVIKAHVPAWHDAYRPTLEAAALVAAQAEAAFAGLTDAADPSDVRWLDERAARWSKLYLQHLSALGLTPAALAKRGLDMTRAAHSEQLRRHLEDTYGSGE